MLRTQSLYRRPSGIYFVRLFVPTLLRAAVGKGEIHRTTGSHDLRVAKIVAAELAVEWHTAILKIKSMDISKIRAGSVMLLGDGFVGLIEAANALGSTAPILARDLAARRAEFSVEASGWLGWSIADLNELEHDRDELGQSSLVIPSKKELRNIGTETQFSGRLRLLHASEAIKVAMGAGDVCICQFAVSSQAHFLCEYPGRPLGPEDLHVRKVDVESLRAALAHKFSSIESISPSEKKPKLRFSKFALQYLKDSKGMAKSDQERRRKDQCDAFAQIMNDPFMEEIDRAMMRSFVDKVGLIPDERHNVRRKFKCPNANFVELIALAELHNLPPLTIKSQQRLVDGLSEILEWACTETIIGINPGKGLGGELRQKSGERSAKAHEQRDALSQDDLRLIMSATWFRDGKGKRTAKGVYFSYRPHYFWLPLLALFAGGRLNELSQLYLSDFRVEANIPYVSFNLSGDDKLDTDEQDSGDAADKTLKTISSHRDIPLHSTLLALGLMEYVEALRAAGYTRLFPELKFDAEKGYGRAAGKWFNERYLGVALKIPRNGKKTFHSMRHNFATALGDANVPAQAKSDLMGHSRGISLADDRYDKGRSLSKMKGFVDALKYDLPSISAFSVRDGLEAAAYGIELKDRHKERNPI